MPVRPAHLRGGPSRAPSATGHPAVELRLHVVERRDHLREDGLGVAQHGGHCSRYWRPLLQPTALAQVLEEEREEGTDEDGDQRAGELGTLTRVTVVWLGCRCGGCSRPGRELAQASEDRAGAVRGRVGVGCHEGLDPAYDVIDLAHGRTGERQRLGDQRGQVRPR